MKCCLHVVIIEETIKYVLFVNCPDSNVTVNELKYFLAILIGRYVQSNEIDAMGLDRFGDNSKIDPKDKIF